MFKTFVTLLVTGIALSSHAQITADQVIDNSINYHDPNGLSADKEATFHFIETRPKAPDRKTTVMLHPHEERYQLTRQADDLEIVTTLSSGTYSHLVDDRAPSSAEIEQYRLEDARSDVMRTYYNYLWYMPMKLNDPGTIIDPTVKSANFFGKEALEIRVTYDPAVGNDIWYFYFDPSSYAMIGYRFYHEESANDGEYILLEGETTNGTVRLPKSRTWYTHKDDRLLGTDVLDRLSVR